MNNGMGGPGFRFRVHARMMGNYGSYVFRPQCWEPPVAVLVLDRNRLSAVGMLLSHVLD